MARVGKSLRFIHPFHVSGYSGGWIGTTTPDEDDPMKPTETTAYSYIRFSSLEQAKGDSPRRQTEMTAKWCERHGVKLSDDLKLRDEGTPFARPTPVGLASPHSARARRTAAPC
jgi:hypothetical protein